MMKQIDLLKLGDAKWVRKSLGYRIRCNQHGESRREAVLMPSEDQAALDSDVLAWRLAYKLAQIDESAPDGLPLYTDITVVNDQGEPFPFYATGNTETLNAQGS